jgi:prepilin-type processing-associated H-X9-DG protein
MAALAILYAGENEGRLMGGTGNWSDPAGFGRIVVSNMNCCAWLDVLFAYGGKNLEFLDCPSSRVKRRSDGLYQVAAPYPRRTYQPGYLINHQISERVSNRGIPLGIVVRPELKVLFADGSFGGVGTQQTTWVPSDQAQGVWDTWSPTMCYFAGNATQARPVSKRHKGGSNVAFFDGHGEWKAYEAIMAWDNTPPPKAGTDDVVYRGSYRYNWDPDEDNQTTTP